MTTFNFSELSNVSAVNTSKYLKPWEIYEVKFDGINQVDIPNKNDESNPYKTVAISFTGESGNFTKNLFIPQTEEDKVRREYDSKEGRKIAYPSRYEEFIYTILQLAQVLNPESYPKMMANISKCKTIGDFIKLASTIINAKKGAKTHLKVTGRNSNGKVYADIPRVCAVNKDGDIWVSNNFVGDNLEFTAYEVQQAKAYHEATPTDMSILETENNPDKADSDNLDFDAMLEL